tara:strand:- start:41 stop:1777 length:1737 start_codon:yes stop_codon:yes gene_type:complete
LKDLLRIQLSSIPSSAGVYQFFDVNDKIIYIGKAKNLKKRVSSYFYKKHDYAKTKVMISKIDNIKYFVVDNEIDALLLENNLIKKYQPKYNVRLKDDKTYPWICITNDNIPKVIQTRKISNDGSEFYGPFTSTHIIKLLLDFFSDLFYDNGWDPYSYLNRDFDNKSKKEYLFIISKIRKILNGNIQVVIDKYNNLMNIYSENLEFEKAQDCKMKILMLKNYQSKSSIVNPKINNVDVFSIYTNFNYTYVNFLKIISGSIVQAHTVELKKRIEHSEEDLLSYAIIDIRKKFNSDSKIILSSKRIDIKIPGVKIIIPRIGDKYKIVQLSKRNAIYMHKDRIKNQEKIKKKKSYNNILLQMKVDLKLNKIPKHIECFDNSNLQGTNPVSACVVFKEGKPSPKDYRHFNIKTVKGPDDFKSMEEVIYRRYKRVLLENKKLPQLIIVDGGKGQLSASIKVLKKLNLLNKIEVIAIAKRLEQIFLLGDNLPLYLDRRSETLRLIQNLRNEAHRFSITHHRKKRSKNAFKISLEDIPGIGPETIKKLLNKFKSVKKIYSADHKELSMIIGEKKSLVILKYKNKIV